MMILKEMILYAWCQMKSFTICFFHIFNLAFLVYSFKKKFMKDMRLLGRLGNDI